MEVTSKNICAGGAFFELDTPLPVGTDVKVDMVICLEKFNTGNSNRAHIGVSGSVVRSENQGMAVSFDKHYKLERLKNPLYRGE